MRPLRDRSPEGTIALFQEYSNAHAGQLPEELLQSILDPQAERLGDPSWRRMRPRLSVGGFMRKLFRMQYEPCNGQCYTDDEVLSLANMTPDEAIEMMDLLTAIHEPACGNANVRYAIDLNERVFVAVFLHYGKIETFADTSLTGVVRALATAAKAHFASPIWQQELLLGGDLGHRVCHHGEDEDLRRFMVQHGGLTPEVRAELLERLAA